jgi:hypothetical protein
MRGSIDAQLSGSSRSISKRDGRGAVLFVELREPLRVAVNEHHAGAGGHHRLGAGLTYS